MTFAGEFVIEEIERQIRYNVVRFVSTGRDSGKPEKTNMLPLSMSIA